MRALTLFASAALLVAQPVAADIVYEDLDSNRDGYLSLAEVAPVEALYRAFGDVDADRDNRLNIDEYVSFMSAGRFTPPEESEEPEPGAAPVY